MYCLPSLAFNEEMLSRNTSFVLLMGKNISETLAHACSPRIINVRPSQTAEKFQGQPELSWPCLQKSGAGCVDDRALAQHHKSEPSFPGFWHKVNVANFNFLLNTRFLVLVFFFSHLFKCCFFVFMVGIKPRFLSILGNWHTWALKLLSPCQAQWHTSVMPAFSQQKQEDQEFRASLCYRVSSRQPGLPSETLLQKKTKGGEIHWLWGKRKKSICF